MTLLDAVGGIRAVAHCLATHPSEGACATIHHDLADDGACRVIEERDEGGRLAAGVARHHNNVVGGVPTSLVEAGRVTRLYPHVDCLHEATCGGIDLQIAIAITRPDLCAIDDQHPVRARRIIVAGKANKLACANLGHGISCQIDNVDGLVRCGRPSSSCR